MKYQEKSRQRKDKDRYRINDNRSHATSRISEESATPNFQNFRSKNGPTSDVLSDALSQVVIRPNIDNRSMMSDAKNNLQPLQTFANGSKMLVQRRTNELASTSSKQVSIRKNSKINGRSFNHRPVVPQSNDVTTLRSNSLIEPSQNNIGRVTLKRPQFNNDGRNREADRSLPLPANNGKGALRYGQHT